MTVIQGEPFGLIEKKINDLVAMVAALKEERARLAALLERREAELAEAAAAAERKAAESAELARKVEELGARALTAEEKGAEAADLSRKLAELQNERTEVKERVEKLLGRLEGIEL